MTDEEYQEEAFLDLVSMLWTDNGLELSGNTLLRLRQRREYVRAALPGLDERVPMYPEGAAWMAEYQHRADRWVADNKVRAEHGQAAWDGVILQTAYIALSQTDDELRENELLDLAAICVAGYEASRARRATA
ncbi:hypothetical protein [Micromonospora sp. NPDC048839]|uniref:hypothetical protein n=1 Tax=Micromonospora sp. NPDC048839 TaxID=3155641 RepID=UPI0033EC9232